MACTPSTLDLQDAALRPEQGLRLYRHAGQHAHRAGGERGQPHKTLPDLIKAASAQADKIAFSTAGEGSDNYQVLEVLQQATGVKMLHVPYKSGAESLTAVMSGNTDVTAISAVTATGYIQAGQIRPYAVTSSRRLANLPDIPTAKEALGQDVEGGSLSGIAAPAGTPPEVVARLNAAIGAVAGGAMAQDKIYARGSAWTARRKPSRFGWRRSRRSGRASWVARASKGAACVAAGNGSRVSGAVPSLPSRIPFSSSASRAASTNQRTAGFAGSACAPRRSSAARRRRPPDRRTPHCRWRSGAMPPARWPRPARRRSGAA